MVFKSTCNVNPSVSGSHHILPGNPLEPSQVRKEYKGLHIWIKGPQKCKGWHQAGQPSEPGKGRGSGITTTLDRRVVQLRKDVVTLHIYCLVRKIASLYHSNVLCPLHPPESLSHLPLPLLLALFALRIISYFYILLCSIPFVVYLCFPYILHRQYARISPSLRSNYFPTHSRS